MDNRVLIEAGGPCGCFHCLKTFDAAEVMQWQGSTALCPFCHYDTVLSAQADPIDAAFLRRMNQHWFGEPSKIDLSGELARLTLQPPDKPARHGC